MATSDVDSSWWAAEPKDEFYQGDVIGDLPFWTLTRDLKFLERRTVSGKGDGPLDALLTSDSPHFDKDGFFHFLGRARLASGMVLTHDCEFDNKKDKSVRAQIVRLGEVPHNTVPA